jgi:hypothetical protein
MSEPIPLCACGCGKPTMVVRGHRARFLQGHNGAKDLTHQQFGFLFVLNRAGVQQFTRGTQRLWLCQCVCGHESLVSTHALISGHTSSCRCQGRGWGQQSTLRAAHPQAYKTWWQMWRRCTDRRDRAFPSYGGRGITVDPRWKSFDTFMHEMGEKPGPRYSLERLDNHQGYSKENCVWATQYEQTRNTRSNQMWTYNGVTKCLSDWARVLGLTPPTIRYRLRQDWPLADVFSPTRRVRRRNAVTGRFYRAS